MAGAGVVRSEAWEELTSLAHLLGAPVATSIGGKGSIAETDPYALGVIGSNGGLSYRHELVRRADVLFYIGCRQGSVTTEKWTLPANGEKTILQLDVDPERIGYNYETAASIVADAKLGLKALVEEVGSLLSGRPAGKIEPEEITQGRNAHLRDTKKLFASDETPIRPERVLAELLPRLPQTAVLCVDPGTPCPYLSAYHQLPLAGRWFVSPRAHGALGYALPAVCGAYFAKPDAERVIGVMGDGSFGISCGELETLVRLKLPVTLIVLNNAGYGWIKAGQKQRGEKYYSVDFSESNHTAIAEAFGLAARRVEPRRARRRDQGKPDERRPVSPRHRRAAARGGKRPSIEVDRLSSRGPGCNRWLEVALTGGSRKKGVFHRGHRRSVMRRRRLGLDDDATRGLAHGSMRPSQSR